MKIPNLILILALGMASVTVTGCKKGGGDSAEVVVGASSITATDKKTVLDAIEAKKYDAALEALGKLRDKVKGDVDVQEYKRVLNEAMTLLRIQSGTDDNAKAALSTLTQMATGR